MRLIRNVVWWLLSPFAWGTAMVAIQARRRVLAGPFAGMLYPASFVTRLLFWGPYQVGSFELELHPAIERVVAARPGLVVNVGGAEGYYAVGLAMRAPEAAVIAFELDPALRAAAGTLARLNSVESRVQLRGLCTVDELEALAGRAEGVDVFVLMDCEGAERELADPERVPWLATATLLVELHPAVDPEIRERLDDRLRDSHDLELITHEVRRASAFDNVLRPIRGLRRIDRELLVAEFRDGSQDWMIATPHR